MSSWAARFERRQFLKGSLWVLPVLGGILGGGLAQLALWIDREVTLPAGWHYSAGTASGVLTAIVGAMVALLGFVVTIGVLVVQQATGSLSPRYMRLWYRDRLQKIVLATFAGTLTFSFSLLRRVESHFVPDIGVTIAGAAVAASLALLLVYLDRFTHRLRPVAVAALVGQAGQDVLADWIGQLSEHHLIDTTPPPGRPLRVVPAGRVGAVQAINLDGLIGLARRYDCTFVAEQTVGDFVDVQTPLVGVFGTAAPDAEQLRGHFAIGGERTIEQDPAFALRILVDIAIKALSPAINDPTTAVQILDRIEAFLQAVAATSLRAAHAIADADGVRRLIFPGRTWEDFLSLAVTEIREYGAHSTQVCRRLRAMLDGLSQTVPVERQPAIRAQLCRLDATIERSFADPSARALAAGSDRQGIGGRSVPDSGTVSEPRTADVPPPP